MIKNIKYVSIFLVLFACQSLEKAPAPDMLIGEDRMVEILTDIAFVKAAKTSNRFTFEEKNINPESFILNKYKIDSVVFAENNAWYSDQIEKYKTIITRVKENLDKEKTKYEKIKKEEDSIQKIQDSIKKANDTLGGKKQKIVPELERWDQVNAKENLKIIEKPVRSENK